MTEDSLVGKIVRCPVEVSESGWLRIVGQNSDQCTQPHMNWFLKAIAWDVENSRQIGSGSFDVTRSEWEAWKELKS